MEITPEAVEIEDEIYRCSHCAGFVLMREERTYDKNEDVIEEQKWIEHWDTLPGWVDEDYPFKTMDMFG